MIDPTPETVRAFWSYMQQEYGSKVIPKATSAEMKAVATFLDLVKIQDYDTFMKVFTTTIGRRIYIPFEIGVPGDYDLWGQIRVCVHEHQHVEQGDRDGWVTFGSRYVTSSSFRAGYEAEAFGSDMEMEYWRWGDSFDLNQFAQARPLVLKSYGCSDDDIDQARATLTIRAGIVAQGIVANRSTQRAVDWLGNHAPALRAA